MLTLFAVKTLQSGTLTCTAVNEFGQDKASATVVFRNCMYLHIANIDITSLINSIGWNIKLAITATFYLLSVFSILYHHQLSQIFNKDIYKCAKRLHGGTQKPKFD